MQEHEIRADFDHHSIVVYQAYRPEIALAALAQQRFVPPFSMQRTTWIKPSFLWMMERSNWAQKAGQECVLGVRITRAGWEAALTQAVLTSFTARVYRDHEDWRQQFNQATVHVQWDPERTLRGQTLPYRSIQVGLSRHIIARYVTEWTVQITDMTPLVRKLHQLIQSGHTEDAKRLLPTERVYPLDAAIGRRLGT